MRSMLLVALLLAACSGQNTPRVENPAPDFHLSLLGGGDWKLSKAIESGPVLIDFWATWCAPCKITMPLYQELADKYGDRGLQVVSISEDHPNQHDQIAPFFEKAGLNFPVLLDGKREVGMLYNVQMLPTSVLIDERGGIVSRHVGYRQGQEKELEQTIVSLLDGTLRSEEPAHGEGR